MTRRDPVVAIDGLASSGKSSVGASVAAALGFRFLDTGLLYRALTWLALERGLDPADGPAVAPLAAEIDLGADEAGRLTRVVAAGRDIADDIRTPRVDRAVSAVARQSEVRAALLGLQRRLAAAGRIVLAGRDIGTVVLPDADVKVWLDASAEERAARRAAERGIDPGSAAGRAILEDLLRRDRVDSSREVSPAKAAFDAVHVLTDGRTFGETVARPGGGPMSRLRGRGSGQEEEVFALPADRLPFVIRASDAFGRSFIQCFTRVTVEGLERVPSSGALILSANHISNADPPFMASWLTPTLGRPIHWMAKAEALEWPLAGWFMRQNGAFGIRRGAADTEAFRLARRVLDEGRVLGAFPEGTRSPTGTLQRAKDGVTLLALRTGAPVLPVGVIGTDRFWPRGQALWGVGGRITLRVGEPFVLERGQRPDGDRESLEDVTTRLMLRIAALLPERQRGVYGPILAGEASAAADDPNVE